MSKAQLVRIGKKLGVKGLLEGASGNISFREGNNVTITRKGTILDELNEDQFITVNLNKGDGEVRMEASSDYIIHEAIYRTTDFKAVVHCHGVYNVVISLVDDEITPPDFEGKLFLGDVPVVEMDSHDRGNAESIAQIIKKNNVAVVRGHGIYSADYTLSGALNRIEYVEHSCEVLYMLRLLKK